MTLTVISTPTGGDSWYLESFAAADRATRLEVPVASWGKGGAEWPTAAGGDLGATVRYRNGIPASVPTLIGIAGFKRAGKDTLARGLCAALELPQDSFAAPLRRFMADLLGWTLEELEARKEDPIPWLDGITPRNMMQTVGTEWGRDMVHGDLWVRSLLQRLAGGGVISDVRFANEAEAILSAGGCVIRVDRPGAAQGDGHASETPIPDHLVSFRVVNSGSPAVMVGCALLALQEWGRRNGA